MSIFKRNVVYLSFTVLCFVSLLLGGDLIVQANTITTDACQYKKFRVTAYYSPLQSQDYYFQGDYNAEVYLNGFGTHGASGWPVHNGLVAGPASYPFGTNIYFPGRGVGVVGDRGQAIVEKGKRGEQYDRIDIRVGKGEVGLQRALSFGVQYLDGYICPDGVIQPDDVGFNFDAFPTYDEFFAQTLWIMNLAPGRRDPRVKELQKGLVRLGYLTEESTTGFFGRKTKAAVCMFQQKSLGLDANSERCGYFGKMTRTALLARLKELPSIEEKTTIPVVETVVEEDISQEEVLDVLPPADVEVFEDEDSLHEYHTHLFMYGEFADYRFERPFAVEQWSKEIRILQRKLQWFGYYPADKEITGVYDAWTLEAVYVFQLANGLVTETSPVEVRGYFGPGTRAKVNACGMACVVPK